jgi:hypothetical protein
MCQIMAFLSKKRDSFLADVIMEWWYLVNLCFIKALTFFFFNSIFNFAC